MPALSIGRQETACHLRAQGRTMKFSYEQAGYSYSDSAASNFFKKPHIVKRIAEIRETLEKRQATTADVAATNAGITKGWVLERLKYVVEVAIRGRPIRDPKTGRQQQDADGKPMFDGKMQGNTAVAGLRLLGIETGMFVQRHEIGDPGEFARLTESEIAQRIRDDMQAMGATSEMLSMLMAQAGFGEDTPTVGEA